MLDSGLVVVGVGLGSHPEAVCPEGSSGEDTVVLDLIPLESVSKLLRANAENLLCILLQK